MDEQKKTGNAVPFCAEYIKESYELSVSEQLTWVNLLNV